MSINAGVCIARHAGMYRCLVNFINFWLVFLLLTCYVSDAITTDYETHTHKLLSPA